MFFVVCGCLMCFGGGGMACFNGPLFTDYKTCTHGYKIEA